MKMNVSNCSLTLSGPSQVSITESETVQTRHNYYTRSAARSKSQASNVSIISDAIVTRKSGNLTPSPIINNRQLINNQLVMRRNYNTVLCNQNYNQWERICRYVIIFFAIGSVVLICSYLGHSLSESQGSVDCVKKELKKFKTDMFDLKGEVQDIISNKEHTNKKLEIIQGLLTDLKSSNAMLSEIKEKCDSNGHKQKASSSDITNALNKYDADKTGKTDFALESAGGSIVTIKDTENYPIGESVRFLGVPLCPASNGARTMIQPGNLPGECWAFKGSKGVAIIRLLGKVRVTSVSLEHIQKSMSPSGEITTAPKDFSITGLKCINQKEGLLLGKFTYNSNGPPIQEFKVASSQNAFNFIEFKVHSNHGNPDFTCVYRLRIHGELEGKRI
ncbi:SUN domain-containing protein 1-like isoform X2 [Onthophagus taurus]|uniref:SUN domain-containing protein 1-like isoform X2 n=1 Tax=Onthophagus taurus TaxID=166361 RepID=UPI000C203B84|nr:SUN domain-containing protein 1-like isoform X2 [Onthophagus taurus]